VGLSHVCCLCCCSINVVKAVNLYQSHNNNTCHKTMCNIQQFITLHTYSDDITVQVCQRQYQLYFLCFQQSIRQSTFSHRHSLQFYSDLFLINACFQRNYANLIENAHTPRYGNTCSTENFRVLFLAAVFIKSMFINKVTWHVTIYVSKSTTYWLTPNKHSG